MVDKRRYLIIALLIVLSAYSLITFQSLKEEHSKLKKELGISRLSQKYLNEQIEKQWVLSSMEMKDTIVLKDRKGDLITLDKILKKHKEVVLLYLDDSACGDCQEFEIDLLANTYIKRKKIIVGNYSSAREFFLYMNILSADLDYYYLESSKSLFKNSSVKGNVIVMVLDEESIRPSLYHCASSSYPEISKSYYNKLQVLLNETNI